MTLLFRNSTIFEQNTFFFLFFAVYCLLNAAVFGIYGIDKIKAKADFWRVPEKTLLGMAVLAPFGAFAGMMIFRHKTKKKPFPIFVPALAIIHSVFLIAYGIIKGTGLL